MHLFSHPSKRLPKKSKQHSKTLAQNFHCFRDFCIFRSKFRKVGKSSPPLPQMIVMISHTHTLKLLPGIDLLCLYPLDIDQCYIVLHIAPSCMFAYRVQTVLTSSALLQIYNDLYYVTTQRCCVNTKFTNN